MTSRQNCVIVSKGKKLNCKCMYIVVEKIDGKA